MKPEDKHFYTYLTLFLIYDIIITVDFYELLNKDN